MRIAVVHHRTRGDKLADLDALTAAARTACEAGAGAVVFPFVPALSGLPDDERAGLLERIEGCAEGVAVYISFDDAREGGPRVVQTPLGRTGLLGGDACLRTDALERLLGEGLDTMIWRPRAESMLQAEAILEFALGCAPSVAGVLLLAECTGGTGHDGCQGTSVIIHAGEIMSEAGGEDDEIIYADLDVPQRAPEPSLGLPVLPLILQQRLAVHEGRRLGVEYPADLS